jgi:hypothetical protein
MMMAILQKHFGCKSRKGNPKHQHPCCNDARNIQVVKMAGNVPCFQITIHSSRKHRSEDGSSQFENSTTIKLTINYEILCSYAKHTSPNRFEGKTAESCLSRHTHLPNTKTCPQQAMWQVC